MPSISFSHNALGNEIIGEQMYVNDYEIKNSLGHALRVLRQLFGVLGSLLFGRPRAKNCAAYSHVGGTVPNGILVIAAHPHAQLQLNTG